MVFCEYIKYCNFSKVLDTTLHLEDIDKSGESSGLISRKILREELLKMPNHYFLDNDIEELIEIGRAHV